MYLLHPFSIMPFFNLLPADLLAFDIAEGNFKFRGKAKCFF